MDAVRIVATWGLACALVACSGSTKPAVTGPTCFDAANQPTATCALTPTGDVCSMGDANACTPLTTLEVHADDGSNGVCLRLVHTNDCNAEVFADTCIEYDDPQLGMGWQCWTSSTLPSFAIDVSHCHATGSYFFVASTSQGQLATEKQACNAPG